jgi:quinol-cytochrome oxidoreductase complex cytochrome b subunit
VSEDRDIQQAFRNEASDTPTPAAEPIFESPDPEPEARVRIFPDLFISATTAILVMLCIYSALCIAFPASLETRADPYSRPVALHSSWYLSYLMFLLQRFSAGIVAVLPILLTVVLAAWPFLDRSPARRPEDRTAALAFGAFALVSLLALTYLGWAS